MLFKFTLDRDKYIHINFDNIKKEQILNFKKIKPSQITTTGTKYDPLSIMHYGPKTFTSNGNETILLLNGTTVGMGQRKGFSKIDKIEVERFYGCKKRQRIQSRTSEPPCSVKIHMTSQSLFGPDDLFDDCNDYNKKPKRSKKPFLRQSYKRNLFFERPN